MTFKTTKKKLASIPQGHYTVESLVNELTKSFKINKSVSSVLIEKYKPNSVLKISLTFETNNKTEEIKVSHDLARLIGTSTTLGQDEYIKKLNSPSTYFIHCDLIDKNQNFLNKEKSDRLATFDIKGKPYEKVSYDSSPQQPLRDCSIDCVYLPSAPPEQLYPELPTQPQPDFRMQKVNEMFAALNKEVRHYRAVAKKHKRAKKVVNWSAAGSSVLSAAFSCASLALLSLLLACCDNPAWRRRWGFRSQLCHSTFSSQTIILCFFLPKRAFLKQHAT